MHDTNRAAARCARAQPQDDAVSGWLRRRCAVGATATAATAAAGRAAAVAVAVVRAKKAMLLQQHLGAV